MVNGEFYVREGTIMMYAEEDLVSDLRRLLAFAPADEHAKPPSTPVEPLSSTPEGADADASDFVEGFKIIQRPTTSRAPGPILPLHTTPPSGQELPANVRRVFGEDDV
jgi:hypothetical protein